MNVTIYTRHYKKISKLLEREYDSYIRQNTHIVCLLSIMKSFILAHLTNEMGSSRPVSHTKAPPKMPTDVWNWCFKNN